MNRSELLQLDMLHNWHPCSQMKDYEVLKPLIVQSAQGSYLELDDGKKIIDAISSWWCKSLGHNHPKLKQAILKQIELFEHVIFCNTTNETIIQLSKRLAELTSSLKKVFYASDGSCAVEIALKMSLHARQLQGELNRTQFIALSNGYHGETCGAMSVSDIGLYRDPYQSMLFATHFISPIPYVLSTDDPLWHDCSEQWHIIEQSLEPFIKTTTALILEPILQGAGGMLIYSQDFLRRLREWTAKHQIHLIADEIMTGLGRTGKMLASEHANIEPDFLCLSKGLTAGWLPLSAVLTRDDIYQLFYDDYSTGKSFLHSHTYSGNVLAASVANAVLTTLSEDNILEKANQLGAAMVDAMNDIADVTQKIHQIRHIGAMVAADLKVPHDRPRLGFEVYQKAIQLGALLRPIGNTIYWLPPLNTDHDTILKLKQITQAALEHC